ncbi:MAG: TonB-dependent receptor [Bacteroidaceae bacterium]|nr:TonB-dependent receptor [Bacteroidaceae bacterium]
MKKILSRRGAIRVLLLLCLIVSTNKTHADIIRGRVIDADTKEPVPEAALAFEQRYDICTSIYNLTADSIGNFLFFADGNGTLKASMLGYYPKSKMVFAFSDTRKDTTDIGAIELKMSPYMLELVEVNARARRFSVKGDTIVFHPEAFRLQEGARLDEHIRQLPGVEVGTDGSLTWNGKPIRITMDGDELFGSNELVSQLPAEAVRDIKAYNKASKFSERTGRDDGTQDMVLDLTIKPGFLDRWYGDVTVGGQTPDTKDNAVAGTSPKVFYEAEVQMNRLSKTDPMMVFADANNTCRQLRRYVNGGSSFAGYGYGQEQGASAGYQHKWQRTSGKHKLSSNYSFSGGLANDDQWSANGSETLNYLPGTATRRTTSESTQHTHKLNPYFRAKLNWDIDSLNTLWVQCRAEHTHANTSSIQQSEQVGILSQRANTQGLNRTTSLYADALWTHFVKDGALDAGAEISYSDIQDELWTERNIQRADPLAYELADLQTQHALSLSTRLTARASGHYKHWLTHWWLMDFSYKIDHQRDLRHQDFELNNTPDAANSYGDRYRRTFHSLNLASTLNLGTLQMLPSLSARWQREVQEYRRGLLDTTAVRRRLLLDPQTRLVWKITKTIGLEASYGYATSQPQLMQTLGYIDTTDPLAIVEGNPDLKDTHTHKASLRFSTMYAPRQLSLMVSADYAVSDCETRTALRYDPATAVYSSRPENVRGSQTWSFRLNYDQGIGDYVRLQNDLRLGLGQQYGFLLQLPTDALPVLNRQNSFNPTDRLTASVEWEWLKASLFASFDANSLQFSASPAQNTTLWQNQYGLRVTVTRGKFEFSTNLVENTRSGYAVEAMNRNFLVWDGYITWKILKNKARLSLGVKDILNSDNRYYATQTAYQQTTSWYAYRHHYIGISFTYRLDAKEKE